MTKEEAKEKIKILYKALNEYVDKNANMKIVELIITLSKTNDQLEYYQECVKAVKEMKKLNIQDEYIKGLYAFDIHEALEISEKEANTKLQNFDFTELEKEKILSSFMGGVRLFMQKK